MVDADFITAQTAEELFRPVRTGTIQRTGFLAADRFDLKTLMQISLAGFWPCVEVPRIPVANRAANKGGSLARRNGTSTEPGSRRAALRSLLRDSTSSLR
jgi:hypothetical protein